jgi:hypothetical protein
MILGSGDQAGDCQKAFASDRLWREAAIRRYLRSVSFASASRCTA